MKIRRLASLAIACFALLMPRLVTSEGAFGGAIATAKPECDSKNINHACSGPPKCVAIPTTETTNNNAERYYVEGTETTDCEAFNGGPQSNCSGLASKPDSSCDR